MKYTPWFTDGEKPARPGVYQQLCGHKKEIGYQRWDGRHWFTWSMTPNGAEASEVIAADENQDDPWRGLATGEQQ
jgi:hypothetical protein